MRVALSSFARGGFLGGYLVLLRVAVLHVSCAITDGRGGKERGGHGV